MTSEKGGKRDKNQNIKVFVRLRRVEERNVELTAAYRQQAGRQRGEMTSAADHYCASGAALLSSLQNSIDNYTSSSTTVHRQSVQELQELRLYMQRATEEHKSRSIEKYEQLSEAASTQGSSVSSALDAHHRGMEAALSALAEGVCACVQQAQDVDLTGNVKRFIDQWYCGAVGRVQSLQKAHRVFSATSTATEAGRASTLRRQRDLRRTRADHKHRHILTCIQETENERAYIEERTSQLFNGVETHLQETLHRINCIEEQLQREKQILHRLNDEVTALELQKKHLVEQVDARKEWLQTQLQATAEEMEMADRDLEESEREMQDTAEVAKKFDKEFDEGTGAISTAMESVDHHAVQAVDHARTELLAGLLRAHSAVQNETNSIVAADAQLVKDLRDKNETLLSQVLDTTKDTLDSVLDSVQSTNASTSMKLEQLTSATKSLESATFSHQTNSQLALDDMKELLAQFADNIRDTTALQAHSEDRYLRDEYKLYSPTGKTPGRVQYRYPRTLAATSRPGRAARRQQHDACEVVDLETSDSSSSSCSEQFLAPSPPALPAPALQKTSSEPDIYSIRKRQENGKENANRSLDRSANKKPSKLPAPKSLKKPLVERID